MLEFMLIDNYFQTLLLIGQHSRQTVRSHVEKSFLTRSGRVMHICVGKTTIIHTDNGLSPGRRQTIIWPNIWILLTGPLEIEIQSFSYKKMHIKMSSGKWRLYFLCLNVLNSLNFNTAYLNNQRRSIMTRLIYSHVTQLLEILAMIIHVP